MITADEFILERYNCGGGRNIYTRQELAKVATEFAKFYMDEAAGILRDEQYGRGSIYRDEYQDRCLEKIRQLCDDLSQQSAM